MFWTVPRSTTRAREPVTRSSHGLGWIDKKSLVLAIRLACDRVLAQERQAERGAEGLLDQAAARLLLRGGQGLLSCEPDLDVILAALDQLDLVHVGDRRPEGADIRPGAAAFRVDHLVAGATRDSFEDGEAAAARAGRAHLGMVANGVTDERHGE